MLRTATVVARSSPVTLSVPQNVAIGVELDEDLVCPCRDHHQQMSLDQQLFAGIAGFPGARTTPDPCRAIVWQAPVPELALDQKTESFLVHGGLAGSNGREHTPNSPGLDPESVNP